MDDPTSPVAIEAFIGRRKRSGASERGNARYFLHELCTDVLDLVRQAGGGAYAG